MLRTPAALHGEDLRTLGEFSIVAGESIPLVVCYGLSFQGPPPAIDPSRMLDDTERGWREWSDRCPDVGLWTEVVKRSLITLKALTYLPSGGIVILSLAMTASSFAQGNGHPRHARSPAASTYSGYYNSAVPEGNYTTYPYSDTTGGLSGAIGGIGH